MAVIEKLRSHLSPLAATLLVVAFLASPRRTRAEAHFAPNSDELQALQRAALRQAHLDERGRKSLEARLRLSALLPHLRVNVGRGWQWDYSSSSSSTTATATLGDDRLSYGVAAQWDLSRLLFQREELVLRRDAQHLAAVRTQLLLRVARLYGQRCAAAHFQTTSSSPDAAARSSARIAALDVALSALTGDDHVSRRPLRCASRLPVDMAEELTQISAEPAALHLETSSDEPATANRERLGERLDER